MIEKRWSVTVKFATMALCIVHIHGQDLHRAVGVERRECLMERCISDRSDPFVGPIRDHRAPVQRGQHIGPFRSACSLPPRLV